MSYLVAAVVAALLVLFWYVLDSEDYDGDDDL